MCGIVGYIGSRDSQSILVEGLKKLEYRGYDSAGVAIYSGDGLVVKKTKGRLAVLESRLYWEPVPGTVGIGHTRWATHGKPSDVNSHPHTDNGNKFSVVHNGIIENYNELRQELIAKGHRFVSETDTEVVSHLLAELYDGDLVRAVREAAKRIRGAYALAILSEHEPDKLVAVRHASPLIIGVGDGENFLGSDIPAILEYTRNVYILEDHEMAVLTRSGVELMTIEGNFIAKQLFQVNWDMADAEKGGYDHFMLKEIHEQPKAYRDTLNGRLGGGNVYLPELDPKDERLRDIRHIHLIGCGTAYHAGLAGKLVLEKLLAVPVQADLASEYRYREAQLFPGTLVIAVSQSGETADTLAAAREAKRKGATVLAVTNVPGSSLAREADHVLLTHAGPEIAVASTKAYTTQLLVLYMLAIHLFRLTNADTENSILAHLAQELQRLPANAERILVREPELRRMAQHLADAQSVFFIGRGTDYAVALEGSLKLKEISYIHSEAYAAGELKHGTLSLIEPGVPVIALATQPSLFAKMISNIQEVKARGAYVYGIIPEGEDVPEETLDEVLRLPRSLSLFSPALSAIPLQLLAYYTAVVRGNDVDKPRNLAKSVTVE